jgi:hypothetical protein
LKIPCHFVSVTLSTSTAGLRLDYLQPDSPSCLPTLCVFNPTESTYTLRKNAVIAQAYEAKELTSVQEVKLQNTEGDDFDAKIDKMVSQAEDNLTSSQLSNRW